MTEKTMKYPLLLFSLFTLFCICPGYTQTGGKNIPGGNNFSPSRSLKPQVPLAAEAPKSAKHPRPLPPKTPERKKTVPAGIRVKLSNDARAAVINAWDKGRPEVRPIGAKDSDYPEREFVALEVRKEKGRRMPYVVWTGKDEAGNKTSGADKVRWWVAYRYNLSAGPAPPPENLENRNGWTIWGDACLDPGKRDLKEANVSDPPPRELTNGVERYGDINYPYLSNRHEEWLQYWPNGKNFITQRHLDQLFHGMKVAASVPQYDMKPWQDALDKRFTPEQQGILDRMFYGRLVRPEVNKTALHVWREYLKNNPHIPADRLSQVGLANLRKMPLYGRPFLIYGSFGHGSAGYENGGFGIALGANSGAEYGPISNFVNLVRHEHEHLTQFREAVMTITSETPTVLSHLIGGIKDLQDATGRPYQGGFLGVKKDNFRGPADNEFARNLPGGKTIKLLEKRFGELKPGSGNIQRLLSHDQKFQTAVIGMFQVLLKRHSAKGFALYTQDEIRRDALP